MASATRLFDHSIPRPQTWRPWCARLWLGASVLFAVVIVALYARVASRTGVPGLWVAYQVLPTFFWAQLAGFIAFPFLISAIQPSAGGRAVQVYLLGSTAWFLALSHHFRIPLAFCGFSAWCICSVHSARLAIRRAAGEEFAGWGMGAAALLGVLTIGCFFLALLHGLMRTPVALLALALAAPGAIDLIGGRRKWIAQLLRPGDMRPLEAVFCEAIWLPLALTFVWACADEVWSDSSRVHLPYARQVMIEGGLPTRVAGDWFRLTPKAVELCYAAAAAASSFRLAKWFSWAALVALAVLVGEETSRRGGGRAAFLFAGAATLGCPVLLWEATSLYIDHFATLACAAAFFCLVRAVPSGRGWALWLAAVLMGAAIPIKYPVLVAATVWCALALLLLVARDGLSLGGRRTLAAVALMAAVAAPWFVRTWCVAGNPVFPFLNGLFRSPYWHAEFGTDFNLQMFRAGTGLWSWLVLPWTVTFQTSHVVEGVDGWLGCWGLALLPFLCLRRTTVAQVGQVTAPRAVFERWQSPALWLTGAAIVAAVGLKTLYLRYWLFAYPLLLTPLLQGVVGMARWRVHRIAHPYAALVTLAALLLPCALWLGVWQFDCWAAYTREITPEEWLVKRFPGAAAVNDLNPHIDPHAGVLCLNYDGVSTVKARAVELRDSSFGVGQVRHAADLPRFFEREQIRYLLVNHSRPGLAWYHALACNGCYDDEKLVAASQGVAIYDLARSADGSRFVAPIHRHIPPALSTGGVDRADWSGSAKILAEFGEGPQTTLRIDTSLEQTVWHNFWLPAGTTMFRCQVPFRGEKSTIEPGCVRLTIEWFDAQWQKVGVQSCEYHPIGQFALADARRHTTGGIGPYQQRSTEDLACIFSRVPPGAVSGAISVGTWNARAWIQTACMTFWSEH